MPKMLQLLRRVFVEKNTLKGSHLLLQLPLLFSRFSASFLYLISSYFDFWGLGVADSFVRDSQVGSYSRSSSSRRLPTSRSPPPLRPSTPFFSSYISFLYFLPSFAFFLLHLFLHSFANYEFVLVTDFD